MLFIRFLFSGILSRLFSYSYLNFSFLIFTILFNQMVFCSCWCSSFLSFISRHSSWFCLMTFSIILVVMSIFLLSLLPSLSSATLRSWFCGTCTVCGVCPPCAPQINVAPHCECRETLNNCNCRCLTQQNLHDYHLQWASHLGTTYNNTFATQQNNHFHKRRLLYWLIGLSIFNVFLLFLHGLFVFFASRLYGRWTRWKLNSRVQRRQHLMHKLNLIDPPVSSIKLPISDPLSSLSTTLENHAQLMVDLNKELQSINVANLSSAATTSSRIH
jgi:hypothetical protein